MANRILVYQDGQRLGIEGTSTGQVLSWNDTANEWELTTPSGGGTVTSITAGTGLSGGTITVSGTIAADFGTIAGKVAEGNDSRFPPAPSAAGRIIYDTGAAWTALAAGTEGKVLTAHGAAAPTWETPAASGVTSITAGTGLSGGTITSTGTIALANTTVTAAAYGTTAAKAVSFTVDAQGRLTAAAETDIAIAATQITSGTLSVERGGTGLATIPQHEVLIGNGTGAITSVALGDGELLIGDTGGNPAAATLSAGTGVSILNAAHSITLSIGQAVGTADSPTFTGLTLSGATASRFAYFNTSKALTALGDGASKLVGYDDASAVSVITLGTGLSMSGATLNGKEGTVTSVAASSPLTVTGTASVSPTVAFAAQSANTVLAGPATGASQAPTFRALTTTDLPALPYDVSGEAAGTPDVSTVIFHFRAARAWTLKGTGSVAGCEVSPTGANVSYTIKKGASSIGTIEFTTGGTNTVTITGDTDVSFSIGDVLTVTTPSDLKTMEAPFFTFLGTCP